MSPLRHVLAGALLCTTLFGSGIAAQAAPGEVCYLGQCGPGAAGTGASAPAKSQLTKVAERGSWGLYEDQDGTALLVDSFADRAKLALVVKNNEAGLVLADPAWDLPAGETYPIRITIDGTVYKGTAKVSSDGKMIAVHGLSRDFLQEFYRGSVAVITVAESRWSFALQPAMELIDVFLTRS